MVNKLAPSQERIFTSLFALAVISLLAFAVLFFILCSTQDLANTTTNTNKPILGQFDSTGASIIIIGMPLLFILLTHLYLHAYRM
jgi:hypothetical protein